MCTGDISLYIHDLIACGEEMAQQPAEEAQRHFTHSG